MKTKTEDELARKGWEPSALTGEEAVKTEERSLEIGESGQFAPSGYYNQQKANEQHHLNVSEGSQSAGYQ